MMSSDGYADYRQTTEISITRISGEFAGFSTHTGKAQLIEAAIDYFTND